jgi:adenylosuccinate lyase
MSLSHITALSPLDGRYAAKLSDLRPIMSEHGYMHRRVQVEVTWFIALSDAGFAEFPAVGRAHYLHGLVQLLRSRCRRHQGHREDHQPRREGRGVLDQVQVRRPPELQKAAEFVHFACTSEDINNTSHALQIRVGRDTVLLPAWTASSQAARDGPPLRRSAHAQPHPRPDRQPHHRGQGNGQRGVRLQKAAPTSPA